MKLLELSLLDCGRFVFTALFSLSFSCSLFARGTLGLSSHGAVIDSCRPEKMRGAIVENIVIYPRANHSSDKKIVRKGILTRYDDSQATVLICHGFMCEKFDTAVLRRLFPRKRFNVMLFDFRAHGENAAGQCCTFGRDEALDVIAAVKFLKAHPHLKGKPVIAYGFSMGAVSAIEAQANDPSLFEAMILDCPFDSAQNVLKRGLANVKFKIFGYQFSIPCRSILERYAFHPYVQSLVKTVLKTIAQLDTQNINIQICNINPAKSVQNVNVPCFFIHCKNDEKVSVAGIKSVFDNAAGHKELWLTKGRRHFDSYFYNPELYTSKVRSFIDRVLAGEFAKKSMQAVIEDDDEGYSIQYKRKVSL